MISQCHTSKLFYQYGHDISLYLTIFLLFLNLVFICFRIINLKEKRRGEEEMEIRKVDGRKK